MLIIVKQLIIKLIISWLERKIDRLDRNIEKTKTKLQEKKAKMAEDQYTDLGEW